MKIKDCKLNLYLNPRSKAENKETYGFKSERNAPSVIQMKNFENDLVSLVQNVKFKPHNQSSNSFQRKISSDIKKIKNDPNVIVKGDKTSNHYSIGKQEYQNVLHNTITKEYKKSTPEFEKQTTKIDKNLAKKLDIADRAEVMPKSESYFQYKDHKEDFQNKKSVRLINSNKSDLGIVSKQVIEKINSKLRNQLETNQWRKTADVIEWFKNIQNKNRATFIIFDIENYYPSITSEILERAITGAEAYVEISDEG